MRKKLTTLMVGLAALIVTAPTQAALDEGGGAAQPSTVLAVDEGFDWADAGIGAGIGAALAVTLGVGVAVRRHNGQTRGVARPAAQ